MTQVKGFAVPGRDEEEPSPLAQCGYREKDGAEGDVRTFRVAAADVLEHAAISA
jgi:hypothetical protein